MILWILLGYYVAEVVATGCLPTVDHNAGQFILCCFNTCLTIITDFHNFTL